MSLVFVPVTGEQLRSWASGKGGPESAVAYTATASLREAFGVTDDEEAERVALLVASVAALAMTGKRLVVVAEAPTTARPGGDPDFGEVAVRLGNYATVSAVFSDEPGVGAAAAQAVTGLSLAQAWDHPQVALLLAEADLLWHGAGEWEAVVAG